MTASIPTGVAGSNHPRTPQPTAAACRPGSALRPKPWGAAASRDTGPSWEELLGRR